MKVTLFPVFAHSRWLLLPAACGFLAFTAPPADQSMVTFQESSERAESPQVLVGHWRKTTVVYESPRDEHLVLHADGTAENWVVTASNRSEPVTGRWSAEGKMLKIVLGENNRELPFTLHEGQLVYPNIQGRRQFWDKLE